MQISLSFDDKYAILGTKNTQYEGVFITAVKSTGIFCRPSCRARKPKAENVIFYESVTEAIENGFRPCKICKPMENQANAPEAIQDLISSIQKEPHKKISDEDLKQRGLAPHNIRRWFKEHYHMTFHHFQRQLRLNTAFFNIQNGKSVTESAYESGYESLSAFTERFHAFFDSSASQSKNKNVITLHRFTTPLGAMFACASEQGLCLLEFSDEARLERLLKDLRKQTKGYLLVGSNKHLVQTEREVTEYFEGKRKHFSVAIDLQGSEFRKKVWEELRSIPYGETRSYKEQAVSLGDEKAVRAVANANGANKIGIIIPCHRVLASNGDLSGYGGGIHRKKWLLDFEAKNILS